MGFNKTVASTFPMQVMPHEDGPFSRFYKLCVLIPVLKLDTVVATMVQLGVQFGHLVSVAGIHKVDVVV